MARLILKNINIEFGLKKKKLQFFYLLNASNNHLKFLYCKSFRVFVLFDEFITIFTLKSIRHNFLELEYFYDKRSLCI